MAPGKRSLTDRPIQRKASAPASEPTGRAASEAVSRAQGGSGSALEPGSRARGESFLGVDLDQVRVHTGGDAAAAAEGISARAYTQGSDIYFGDGAYRPGTPDGDHLIAHELVHVAQQQGGGGGAPQRSALQVSQTHDPAEVEAERGADALMAGQVFRASATPSGGSQAVSRDAKPAENLAGNPAEMKDSAGNAITQHKTAAMKDTENHAGPAAAGGESRTAAVKVIAGEGNKLRVPGQSCPDPDQVYQESAGAAETGFAPVTAFSGTMAAPMVEEQADPGLFIGGQPSAGDVKQGQIGDCFLDSNLMSIAARDPVKVKSMMTPDGRGGATVTLWRRQAHAATPADKLGTAPKYDYIPVNVVVDGDLAFSLGGGIHGNKLMAAPTPRTSDYWAKVAGSSLEVHRNDTFEVARWSPLLEKAFARFAQQYGEYGGARDGKPAGGSGYNTIHGGVAMYALSVLYGEQADSAAADVHRTDTTWAPGTNVLAANPRVVDQLLLLAGRDEAAKPGDADAPIVTAQTSEDTMLGRLGAALPVAIADPDFATLDAERQARVQAVQASWTAWNALPPDVAPVVAKATARTAVGTSCAAAVAPGPVDPTRLAAVRAANPGTVPFANDRKDIPHGSVGPLRAFGEALAANPSPLTNVAVVGHSSATGQEAHNQGLSEDRAAAVAAAIRKAGAVEPPHRVLPSGVGQTGADRSAAWRRVDITVDPAQADNHLHDATRSPNIRAAMDFMLDLRNMGTDKSPGQRNIYGGHSYSILGVSFVNAAGAPVALQSVPSASRPPMFPQVDTNLSTVRLRNPHRTNEPDRLGNNKGTRPEDGVPEGPASDGTFTMSIEEFFRNFAAVDSGVFPKS